MIVNGWQVVAHPLFLERYDRLEASVAREKAKNPDKYLASTNAKIFNALKTLVFQTIPQDPSQAIYRQGATLGDGRKHWFRAKFGGQRFRVFFRFSTDAKIIVFAWVNDEDTLRIYGAKSDAYAVFRGMLDRGRRPDDWDKLLEEAKALDAPEDEE